MEIGKISRTWWRQDSDGRFFRNCAAVDMDMARLVNRLLPWRRKALTAEWCQVFRAGPTERDAISAGDRWIAYDDSPEATAAWVTRLLATHGKLSADGA